MEHAYFEFLSSHVILTVLTSSVVTACMFALVGPIGFYRIASPMQRVVYSALYTLVSLPLAYGVIVLLFYSLRFRSPLEILAGLMLATPLWAFQCTAVIHTIENLAQPGHPAGVRFITVFLQVTSVAWVYTVLYFYVVWQRAARTRRLALHADGGRVTPAAGSGAREAAAPPADEDVGRQPPAAPGSGRATVPPGERSTDARDEPAETRLRLPGGPAAAAQTVPGMQQPAASSTTGGRGTLLNLLPDRLGTDLVYIKSEDHYLEVHTTVGSSLIKMRFSDAVAELGDRGIQVHRSYWVATRHVTRSVRNGKRTLLRLTGDHKVPVSVTHMPAVRALLAR
ncbi:MAG: LytTR family transcriptional regulator DNA-binding domain-containing protein [Spirochaetaceae bacterium]|nr:LytTR family transcriptional regulator DNA-binding domain-containing protein [Spirochaetaceae bacterium]